MCPVCGGREVLEARTPIEVLGLLGCALPACPTCGWAQEEDRSDPVWDRCGEVYAAHWKGEEVKQSRVDDLFRGL
jgi:rubredoxin